MGFQQGVSGLNASAKQLDVIGNNVANVNTVGFKGSRAEFADIYASTFASSSNTAGIGARVTTIAQQFGQGNTTTTNNPLDLAITGNGFFRMQDRTGSISYARNGQFQMDKEGYIVNNGQYLTGWGVDQATGTFLQGSTPQPIQLQFANIGAKATGGTGVSGAGLNLGINLNATDKVLTAPYSSSDPTSYNYSTSATVFDSLGVAHTQTFYFVKDAPPATSPPTQTWSVYYSLDGKDVNTNGTVSPTAGTLLKGTLTYDANGQYQSYTSNIVPPATSASGGNDDWFSVVSGPTGINNGSNGLDFQLYFDKSTQFGSPYNLNTLTQDGYTDGILTGLSVSKEGVVQGRYSNGQTRDVAKVVLATFPNNQGLQPLGDNRWAESFASGQPLVNSPGQGSTGFLQAAAVEDSNVDLTSELVNLITAQRNYQANAQTVKAQDTILQTIVNLR
ncbi:flagellar hook protein FlgE [Chitinibacter sp. S2-10]|uniref:flagellar hook protein FlgE n=1 Tax=Chitinibacter sp. S2-10 TaxID=3373597 RepID=UPI0039773702